MTKTKIMKPVGLPKKLVAKLLATENIDVVSEKIPTAYFDLKSRKIGIPIWENVSQDVYDLMVGHEVGHALYTPIEVLEKARERKIPKSFVNVIEDIRIEKMIQNKYPGLISNFRKGYKELKTGRASGTSEFASDDSKIYGEGTIAGLSNNELLKRKFEQRRRYKKLEEEDKIINPYIQTPAQQEAGESASNDRGDPGIDFSSARTGTTDFKNPDTDKGPGTVFKNVTTYDTEKVKAIAKANAEKGIYTPAKAKGGLITKPKKTKKKTKAYKKGGLASKK
jgi:hypothetical protein